VLGDPTIADAILDRVIHNAHRLQLRGRLRSSRRARSGAGRAMRRGGCAGRSGGEL